MGLARHLQLSKHEKLDLLSWNRRLSKAGLPSLAGKPGRDGIRRDAIPADPSLVHLRVYRVRKDRTANGYRTSNKFYDEVLRDPVYWVQDTRSGERVTDRAILAAIVAVVNDRRKWKQKTWEGTYKRGGVTFDKDGPRPLSLDSLEK